MVFPVGDDVAEGQRRDSSEMLVEDLCAVRTKLGDCIGHLYGVPDQYGIREETQARSLVHEPFHIPYVPENPLVGETQPPRKALAFFSSV